MKKVIYVEQFLICRMISALWDVLLWIALLAVNQLWLGGSWMVTATVCFFIVMYTVTMSTKHIRQMTTKEAIKFFSAMKEEQDDRPGN